MTLYKNKMLRKLLMPIFQKLNFGNITIKHPETAMPLYIHSFKHKVFWFHGKNYEKNSADLFKLLIGTNQTVIEIGAHIGYFTQFISKLVGAKGKLFVFEPGENNLVYTRKNVSTLKNTELIEKAASDINGIISFYVENFSGQTNSLVRDEETFANTIQVANVVNGVYKKVDVQSISIDDFIKERNIHPDFIKIDVEGGEPFVLKGMVDCLKNEKPMVMIEITKNKQEILRIFEFNGYILFDPEKNIFDLEKSQDLNAFCLHQEKHAAIIKSVFLSS